MNLNEIKKKVAGWKSSPFNGTYKASQVKAKRFTEVTRRGNLELVLAVLPTRDGLEVEIFEPDGCTRNTGTLFRMHESPDECFDTFSRYLRLLNNP